jgi:hypothetical protein
MQSRTKLRPLAAGGDTAHKSAHIVVLDIHVFVIGVKGSPSGCGYEVVNRGVVELTGAREADQLRTAAPSKRQRPAGAGLVNGAGITRLPGGARR